MRLFASAIALLIRTATAVFADEAGSVDYHLALLGQPGNSTTFFHQPVPGSKASLVYTLSDRNVIGAVNPKDGAVVWRHLLSSNKSLPRGQVSTADGHDVLLTAVKDTVSSWAASDGRLQWDSLHESLLAKDVEILAGEQDTSKTAHGDAVTIWSGKNGVVKRLDATTGTEKWSHEDSSGSLPYRVTASADDVFAVGLSKAMLGGYKLHITILDVKTGKLKDQITLSSESEISSEQEVLHVGHIGSFPSIIWTDSSRSTVKVNVLGSKNIASFDIGSAGEPVQAVAVHSGRTKSGASHFLVESKTSSTHGAQVFHIEGVDAKKVKVTKAYDLPNLPDKGSFASSVVDNDMYFVRLASEVQLFSSASHGVLARWPLRLPKSSHASIDDWRPVHAAAEVVARPDSTYAVRSTILRDTGDWALVRNGEVQWTRPEQLSSIVDASWAETNQTSDFATELEVEHEADPVAALLHRLRRHIAQLSRMPALIQVLPDMIVKLLDSFVPNAGSKDNVFGFDKEVRALLEDGRTIAFNPRHPESVRVLARKDPSEAQGESRQHPSRYSYKSDGHGLSGSGPDGNNWHFTLPKGEEIFQTLVQAAGEKVASIGKVLGDRNVLYKYLNPNAILVLTKDNAKRRLSVYLLDAISGAVLYAEEYDDIDLSRPVSAIVSENWFTYSFTFDVGQDSSSKGHLLIVGESYESEFPNDRGPLGASSNYSAIDPALSTPGMLKPHVISQTYHIPEEIAHMAITQTEQGITSRQLLVTLASSNAIVGLPHHVLDPRRPVGRAATNQEMEEGLMQYNPLINFEPNMYLTHTNDVLGIEKVVSSPSDMESTSLVFAYGLDVFGTRVAPSFAFDILSASFNKIQLILTVTALTVGVFVVTPLISRKQTNVLWQSS